MLNILYVRSFYLRFRPRCDQSRFSLPRRQEGPNRGLDVSFLDKYGYLGVIYILHLGVSFLGKYGYLGVSYILHLGVSFLDKYGYLGVSNILHLDVAFLDKYGYFRRLNTTGTRRQIGIDYLFSLQARGYRKTLEFIFKYIYSLTLLL